MHTYPRMNPHFEPDVAMRVYADELSQTAVPQRPIFADVPFAAARGKVKTAETPGGRSPNGTISLGEAIGRLYHDDQPPMPVALVRSAASPS